MLKYFKQQFIMFSVDGVLTWELIVNRNVPNINEYDNLAPVLNV